MRKNDQWVVWVILLGTILLALAYLYPPDNGVWEKSNEKQDSDADPVFSTDMYDRMRSNPIVVPTTRTRDTRRIEEEQLPRNKEERLRRIRGLEPTRGSSDRPPEFGGSDQQPDGDGARWGEGEVPRGSPDERRC